MSSSDSPLVDRIVRALRTAASPRSSADLAREFLGTGPLDERQAALILDPVLAQHPGLAKTAHGWTACQKRAAHTEAGPRLGDGFLAVFAPARAEIAAARRGGPPGAAPAYTVCAAGEPAPRRFEALSGETAARPVVDLANVARRLRGYRGPADPVRIAEGLHCPHLESDDPAAMAGVVVSAWERLVDQLALDGVFTEADLSRLLDDRLEAADFEGKEFGPGELAGLPDEPGVYAFLDGRGSVLYVGQSSTLGARVRSYFVGPPRDEKDRAIRRGAVSLLTSVARSAPDALIAEARWIRERRPRLNSKEAVRLDAAADGVVVAPRVPRGRVAFTVSGGALRERVALLPGPRRAPRAADRAIAALNRSGDASASRRLAATLVDRWRRAHPEAPHLRPAIDGPPERLRALLVDLARDETG